MAESAIKTIASVGDFKRKKGGVDLKLTNMKIAGADYEKLSAIIDGDSTVRVSLDVVDATLPGTT